MRVDSWLRIAAWTLCAVVSASAQDWVPKRIVAIRDYVPLAKMARVAGIVEVKCILDDNGSVRQADVISGHKLLKEQTRQNALLWQFQRTSSQVKTNTVTLIYEYLLEGPLQDHDNTVFLVEMPNRVRIIAPPAFIQ